MYVEHYLNLMRTGHYPLIDDDLLESLNAESTVQLFDHPLHNKYINYYSHSDDDMNGRPRDTTPVRTLSRLYVFRYLREDIACNIELADQGSEAPECAVQISSGDRVGCLSVICRTIWDNQRVSDLYIWYVEDFRVFEAPTMSKEPRLVNLNRCNLPDSFFKEILRQLFGCGETLQKLELGPMNLRPFESLLDELLEDLVAHHEAGLAQRELQLELLTNLSKEFVEKWRNRCEKVDSIDCRIHY